MGLLSNGSDLLGINPYVQQAIIGAVIIIAVALDEARKRRILGMTMELAETEPRPQGCGRE